MSEPTVDPIDDGCVSSPAGHALLNILAMIVDEHDAREEAA